MASSKIIPGSWRWRRACSYGEWRSCRKKWKHLEYLTAMRAANEVEKISGGVVEIYPCKYCDGMHIGHEPRKKKRARSRFMKAVAHPNFWLKASPEIQAVAKQLIMESR